MTKAEVDAFETKFKNLIEEANKAGCVLLHNVTREDGNHLEEIRPDFLCVLEIDKEPFDA